MNKTVHATYDGEVLRPEEPVPLAPNTRVRITIETAEPAEGGGGRSFLEVAASLSLDGPADWSERLEEYLYGQPDVAT